MKQILLFHITLLCSISANLNAQQEYSGNSVLDCLPRDTASPSTDYLYTCNGKSQACSAFLIFRSQPAYHSVATISHLMSVEPSEIARINRVTATAYFDTNKEVIIPVTCSCSGKYYQANSSYVTQSDDETYFLIANDIYEGLSSCSSLKDENSFSEFEIRSGLQLTVPLRCACPTAEQIGNGTSYLLTYSITWNDSLYDISQRFNASLQSTADANRFSDIDTAIHPFTTILIPLTAEPSISSTNTPIPLPVSPLPPVRLAKSKRPIKGIAVYIGIGVGVGSALVVLLVGFLAWNCYEKKRSRSKGLEGGVIGKKNWVIPKDLLDGIAHVEKELKVFSVEELKESTDNFSSVRKIKGSVYRGIINGEVPVAIKMRSRDVTKEVRILNKINHFNLITLHGFCIAQGNSYLVSEYMEKGSLKDWLSQKRSSRVLSWNQRMQIAMDVANGLHYLHNCIKPAYIHNNIKSSNILLNGKLRAKIANFSRTTARLDEMAPPNEEVPSRHVTGTTGYLAPEYMDTRLVTPMLDVYAFGVLLLELISGRSAAVMQEGNELLLSTQMVSMAERGNLEAEVSDWIDPRLSANYRLESLLAVTKLSTACLRGNPENRPGMDEVVSSLTKIQVDSLNSEYL